MLHCYSLGHDMHVTPSYTVPAYRCTPQVSMWWPLWGVNPLCSVAINSWGTVNHHVFLNTPSYHIGSIQSEPTIYNIIYIYIELYNYIHIYIYTYSHKMVNYTYTYNVAALPKDVFVSTVLVCFLL